MGSAIHKDSLRGYLRKKKGKMISRIFLWPVEVRLFFVIWLVYVVHVVPGGGVNPNRYFDLTYSLVEHRTIAIDNYHENTIDKAFKDGHYYSAGLPGPSLLAIPAYLTFKMFYYFVPESIKSEISQVQSFKTRQSGFYQQDTTSFFISTIWITWFALSSVSALASVFLFRTLNNLGVARNYALLATVLYAWGTPVFFYSTTYFSHVFHASFAIFALYFLSTMPASPGWQRLIGLGLLCGSTILIEYQGMIVIAGFGLYILWKYGGKALVLYSVGAVALVTLLLIYNTMAFDAPLLTPHQFLVGPNRETTHGFGLLGFTLPTFPRMWGLVFSLNRGLFLYSPILCLAPLGWLICLRQQRSLVGFSVLSILVSLSLLAMIAGFQDWGGGAAFGPRYLIMSFPFLIIGVAIALERIPRSIWIPLAFVSILTNWLGAQYGFAVDVFEPYLVFLQDGFTLPSLSAIISHSGSDNLFSTIIERFWPGILFGYALFIGLLGMILVGIASKTSTKGDL